jgi:hypothetical protein
MKKIVFAFILTICSSVTAIGQDTQQPRYLSICQQAEKVYNAEGAGKAVKFLAIIKIILMRIMHWRSSFGTICQQRMHSLETFTNNLCRFWKRVLL